MPNSISPQLILEQSNDLIWMVSPNFQLIYANEAYLRLMKQATGKEKKINTSVFEEAFGNESVKNWEGYYNRAIKGETFELEEQYTNPKTKKVHYSHVTLKPIYGDNQEVEAVACQSKEISQTVNQQLQANQLIDASLDVFCSVNEEGLFTYVSAASIDLWGYTPGELIGTPYIQMIIEEDLDKTKLIADDIMAGKNVRSFVNRYKRKDGSIAHNIWSATWDKQSKQMFCTARNGEEVIAQRRKVEQNEKRFETLIQNSADCIAIISPEAKTLFISEKIKNILGFSAQETIEMDIWELIHPDDREDAQRALIQAFDKPGVTIDGSTSRIKHKDGSWRWVKAKITNLIHDPSIGGIVDVFSDVTKEKNEELEKELIIDISNIFNQNTSSGLSSCLSAVCESVVAFGDCSFAELWLPDIDKKVLNCTTRYAGTEVGKTFFEATKNVKTLTLDEGAQSQVFKSKKTVLWQTGDAEWDSIKRKSTAEKAGIKTIIGIPLIHNDEVLGGLLLGAEKTKLELNGNSELFKKLETSIGSELSRKKTQIELEQIFNFTPDIICIVGFDGYIKRINPAGIELFGYSLEEVRSRPIQSFVHKEDQPQSERNLTSLYEGNNLKNFENRYITKEGKIVWLSWTATSLPEQSIIYAAAKDITEEKELRELNRQDGRLAKIGGWELDLKTMTPYFSEQTFKIYEIPFGTPPKVEDGIKFYAPEARPTIQEAVKQAIENNIPYELELPFITAKGKRIWVKTIGQAEVIDGKAAKLIGAIQDINERKVTTLALEKSLRELQDYKYSLDQSAIIAFTDNKGIITSVNDNFCKISGYSREELIGQTHSLINAGYHSKAFFRDLWKTIASGKIFRSEIKNKAKDGGYYWVDTTIVPFLDKKQKPTQYLAIRFNITERKKAEDEKAKFQETLENSLNEIYMFDAETLKFSYVNRGALLNLGYSNKEIKALTPLDLKPSFTVSKFNERIAPLIKHKKSKIVFFTHHLRKDGSQYPVEVHLKLVEEGNKKNFIAIILDITDRKKAEEELLSTSERLRLATSAVKMGIWDWDIVNDKLKWDDRMYQLYGVRRQDFSVALDAWQNGLHPDDAERTNKDLQDALSGKREFNSVFRVIWPDRSIRYIQGNAIVSRDEAGNAIRMIGSNIDVTDRKKAEKEIIFQANLLKTFGQAAVASDLEGVVTYWNKAATSIYGWTREEAIGRNIGMLTPSNADEEQIEQIMALLREGKTWTGDIVVEKKDGRTFPARASNSPVYDENGKITGMIGISSDITQEVENKKLLDEYTQKLEKSNQDLANRIKQIKKQNEKFQKISWLQSHKVRAPLVRILGVIELIDSSKDNIDDLPFWLDQLKASSKEMDEVIKAVVKEADVE